MGNVAPCLAGGAVVKVMLPDATIEKYDHPVAVAELASMYPNYAVVHCSKMKPTLGQLRAVILMKMDELLVPGQAYILYPIPKSFNDSIRSSGGSQRLEVNSPHPFVGAEAKTKMGCGRQEDEEGKEDEEAVTAEDLERSLSMTLMGPALRKVPSEASPSSLETQTQTQTQEKKEKEKEKEKEKADPGLQPSTWTPDLYQICED